MRREVLATYVLAAGIVLLAASGFLVTNSRVLEGVVLASATVLAMAAVLAFGSLTTHR